MTPERYARAGEILGDAVLRSPPERAAFVAQACGDDAELRAEVDSLLRHHETRDLPAPAPSPAPPQRRWSASVLVLATGFSALALLGASAVWTIGGIEADLRGSAARELRSTLDFRATALRGWAGRQKERLKAVAGMPDVVRHARELARTGPAAELQRSPSQAFLRDFFSRLPVDLAGRGFVVLDPSGRILSHALDNPIGSEATAATGPYLRRALLGELVLTRPFRDDASLFSDSPGNREPLLLVGGAVTGDDNRIVALLFLRFEADAGFSPLLASAPPDDVIAFDDKGALLVAPKDLGPPPTLSGDRPLGRMGAVALLAKPGVDTTGYPGCRGREVIGAWTWLPEWELGVAAERDLATVLVPLGRLRTAFGVLGGGLSLLVLGGTWVSVRVERRRRTGTYSSYVLERRIAKGGMAEIHLARHTLLKRPAAVKILDGVGADGTSVARFEREARLVSGLSHPNTIQVFDFGRTPDGRFYLAMEYLEGLNFAQLVAVAGPLPPARAIYLLLQACGALEEAHEAGLVHRDIKPTNLMVVRRGGVADLVKVLDFGIARSIREDTTSLTQPLKVSGTPLYIAPERFCDPRSADPRSDLYSLGATAFHLLTGRGVFQGPGPAELLHQVMGVDPPSPSAIRGEPLPPELDRLVLACLSKDPEKRPSGAAALARALRGIPTVDAWDVETAKTWWDAHRERIDLFLTAAAPPPA